MRLKSIISPLLLLSTAKQSRQNLETAGAFVKRLLWLHHIDTHHSQEKHHEDCTVAPGVQLVDTPEFPAEYQQGALAARDALNLLRDENTLDWTFVSPPALLAPGERTGKVRIGADQLLMDGDKPAGISVADLAVAIVDEIEQPRKTRQRFTVAS